jgi:hypothetical protein
MAKYRFKGDASKNEMHPITRDQFNAIKLAHESQYKRIEILYNDKTISMLKEITGVAGSDAGKERHRWQAYLQAGGTLYGHGDAKPY